MASSRKEGAAKPPSLRDEGIVTEPGLQLRLLWVFFCWGSGWGSGIATLLLGKIRTVLSATITGLEMSSGKRTDCFVEHDEGSLGCFNLLVEK